jgi:hypothetical protein
MNNERPTASKSISITQAPRMAAQLQKAAASYKGSRPATPQRREPTVEVTRKPKVVPNLGAAFKRKSGTGKQEKATTNKAVTSTRSLGTTEARNLPVQNGAAPTIING